MELRSIGANMTEVSVAGWRVLFSYSTPVAAQGPDGAYYKTDKKWSVTTTKHITRWGASGGAVVPQSALDNLLDISAGGLSKNACVCEG